MSSRFGDSVSPTRRPCTRPARDPEITRWTATIPAPYPMEAATGWIESHDALWSGGLDAPFAAVDATEDRLLGSMSIRLKPEAGHAVAGYWIAAPERGRGAATRALGLAIGWTRSHSKVPRVELRTMIGNVASERVAQKNGFTWPVTKTTTHLWRSRASWVHDLN